MESKPKTAWNPWPASIIGFFALAIAGCVTFILFCNLHPTDLVAADYYEQEIRYQTQMDRATRAQAEGAMQIQYDPAAKALHLSLPRPQTQPGATGWIELYRPSSAVLDQKLPLQLEGNKRQTVDVRSLRTGLWKVKVHWSSAGKQYYTACSIKVEP